MKLPSAIYHQATIDLLRADFITEPAVGWENAGGSPSGELPASVWEWYSFSSGIEALTRYSNDDHVLDPPSFVLHEYEGQRILKFLIENQGCWHCGFLLDGSDDPPVVITENPSAHRVIWDYCAEQFSAFIYTRIFDHQYLSDGGSVEYDSDEGWFLDGPAPTGEIQQRLETDFQREPSTHLPGHYLHRYSRASKRQRLVIWEANGTAQWQWLASAASERQNVQEYVMDLISASVGEPE